MAETDHLKKHKRTCKKCNRKLKLQETGLCDPCVDEVMVRKKSLLYHFLFQVFMLIVVYLFFFEGILPILDLLK